MKATDLPIEKMQDTQAYKEDWLGLQTLDKAGKIQIVEFKGEHMRIPYSQWEKEVLPNLKGKKETVVEKEVELDGAEEVVVV
jgi:palmitoyl-protein thioesterase